MVFTVKYLLGKKQKLIWGLFLLVAWGAVIVLFMRYHGDLSAKELANYNPENPLLACLMMLGLFTLKSVDFLMHSGVLYAANGIMFPLPAALLLNLVGIVISVTPTYFMGRVWGPPVIEALYNKYPKLRVFTEHKEGGSLANAVLLRTVGLPIQIGSVYMGAANYRFGRFVAGSVLGLLPIMIPYTVMGDSVGTRGSAAFIFALAVEGLALAASVVIYAAKAKRCVERKESAEKE